MSYKNTGVVCFITVPDETREEGFRLIDLGNYFTNEQREKFLLTSYENAMKYWRKVDVPILIRTRGQE